MTHEMPPSIESLQRQIVDLRSQLSTCEDENDRLQTLLDVPDLDPKMEADLEQAEALLEMVQKLRRYGESPRLGETWADWGAEIERFLRRIW